MIIYPRPRRRNTRTPFPSGRDAARQSPVTTDGFDQARKYIPTVIVGAIVVIILGAIWATRLLRTGLIRQPN